MSEVCVALLPFVDIHVNAMNVTVSPGSSSSPVALTMRILLLSASGAAKAPQPNSDLSLVYHARVMMQTNMFNDSNRCL